MFQVSKILGEQTDIMGVITRTDKYLLVEAPNCSQNHAIAITNRKDNRFCRISIFEPKYIGAEGEDYILTEEEIKEITPILKDKWHSILENMNDQFRYDDDVATIDENMEMPNYLELLKGEIVRISFDSQYVVHNNDTGTLSSKERKILDKTMNKQSNVKAYAGLTVWEAIKQAAKDETADISKDQSAKIDNMKCPDFKNIKPAK